LNDKSRAKFIPTYEDFGLVGTYTDEMIPFIGMIQVIPNLLKTLTDNLSVRSKY